MFIDVMILQHRLPYAHGRAFMTLKPFIVILLSARPSRCACVVLFGILCVDVFTKYTSFAEIDVQEA